MLSSLTLSGAPGQALQLTVDMLAHSVSNASAVNTPATLAALSVPGAPRVLWHHGSIALAPYSPSVALSSEDVVQTQGAALTIDNGLGRVNGRLSGLYASEPDKAGATTVTGSVTFPRYVADTLVLAQRAGTPYMMRWEWTGKAIGETDVHYGLSFYFPHVVFETTNVSSRGPGRIPLSLSFTAMEPAAWPAGFPLTLHQPALVIEVVSGLAVNPLL